MLDDLKMVSRSLGSKIDEIREHLDLSVLEKKIAEKESQTCAPDFWNDRDKAEAVLNELTAMKRRVESWQKLFRDYDDILELIQMAESDDDPSWQADGYFHDPLKMILMLRTPQACADFRRLLHAAHIQWEKASPTTVLFLVTAGTVHEHFEYLFRCIRQVRDLIGPPDEAPCDAEILAHAIAGQPAVLPRAAALCDGELVPLEEAEGRIASQLLVPYPPGIPVFIPGLRVTRPMIRLIQDVIAQSGPDAVHGLFTRGKRPFVEVLNHDEADRLTREQ